MSLTKREMEEEEQAQMLMRAITENNVKKIEEALEHTQRHGKGFVLTSQFAKPKQRQTSPKSHQRQAAPRMPIVIGSPIGSPPPSRKSTPTPARKTPPSRGRSRSKSSGSRRHKTNEGGSPPQGTYLTEFAQKPTKVDMAIQSDEQDMLIPYPPPGTPEQRSEYGDREPALGQVEEAPSSQKEVHDTPVAIADNNEEDSSMMREEPIGEDENTNFAKKKKKTKDKGKENRISEAKFSRLDLPKRPDQFKIEPRTAEGMSDPDNPEPLCSHVWVTRVPKAGGEVKTPFYAQVDIPDGALRGDVIMKFETQSYNQTKLNLSDGDKLCSYVIDVNINPLTYCLHKEATVRLRILEECINKYEDVTIVAARHFNWDRIPTKIESREVNGDKHFYAVTNTQYLGKFAVITSQKLDRFVMTSAGGIFGSTILPDVTIKLEEGVVGELAHMVEMSVVESREDAVTKTSEAIQSVREINGHLVASSPLVDITKQIMGKTGVLADGETLPENVSLTIPITTVVKQPENTDRLKTWKSPTIKIMKRTQSVAEEHNGRKSSILPGFWEDITAEQNSLLDPVSIQNGEAVTLTSPVPSQLMVLVFDANGSPSSGINKDVGEVCETLLINNSKYRAALMIHQKVAQPEIINIHLVPEKAADLISSTMEKNGEWKSVDSDLPYKALRLGERDCLEMIFHDGIRLTINQMEPQIQFNSRRWQGYQYQIEATDECYSNSNETTIRGSIDFLQRSNDDEGDEEHLLHTTHVTMPTDRAKPFKSTSVARPLPKVSVFREYKLKWMKNLSEAEKEKYKAINTP